MSASEPGPDDAPADFPPGFLLGSGTAAHQVEGGNSNNDWWAWEHRGGTTALEPSGDAIDQYHRYDEDFALLASLGQQAHRLSLEWSRIEPAPGEFSSAALEHYRRVLASLARHGLTAYVTLHHFSLPRWFSERGGWLADDAVARFERYCAQVADALGDSMPFTCTINEPQIVALFGYLEGLHPPGRRDPTLWRLATRRLREAHDGALRAFAGGGSQLGICLQLPALEPARAQDPGCVALHDELRGQMWDAWLDREIGGDWIGVQYYTRMRCDPAATGRFAPAPDGAPLTLMGWELHPEGLYEAIAGAARATGLPVHVTENGIAAADDAERVAYLRTHLEQVVRALRDGIDVRAYLHWSSFDNFEWAEGYRPTFGLVGIDRADGLRRVVRPSAESFGEVARTRSLRPLM